MEQNTKPELEKKLKGKMPEEAAKFIAWELGRLGELGETTAGEINKDIINPKALWDSVVKKASKELGGKSGAVSGVKVFKWLCEELHIDGVVTRADVAQFVTEVLEGNEENEGAVSAGGNAAALDFDSLFD